MRRGRRASLICGTAVALAAAAAAGAEGPAAWITQGAAYLRSGALGQAEQAFRKAAALAPESARPVLWLGVVAVARGDRGSAVAWFNEALRRHPDLAEQGCAAGFLRQNLDEFHTLPLALAAYNAGRAAVHRWGGIPPYAETQWYVWAVLWVYGGLR